MAVWGNCSCSLLQVKTSFFQNKLQKRASCQLKWPWAITNSPAGGFLSVIRTLYSWVHKLWAMPAPCLAGIREQIQIFSYSLPIWEAKKQAGAKTLLPAHLAGQIPGVISPWCCQRPAASFAQLAGSYNTDLEILLCLSFQLCQVQEAECRSVCGALYTSQTWAVRKGCLDSLRSYDFGCSKFTLLLQHAIWGFIEYWHKQRESSKSR